MWPSSILFLGAAAVQEFLQGRHTQQTCPTLHTLQSASMAPASSHHSLFSRHSRTVGIAGFGKRMVPCRTGQGSPFCDAMQCAYLKEAEFEGFWVILLPKY